MKTISEILDETLNEEGMFSDGKLDLTSFDVQTSLCPTFWDKNLELKEDIRQHLLKIAKDFSDTIDLEEIFPEKEMPERGDIFKDVLFIGSLASYNYSEYSDVDLHILVDLSTLDLTDKETNLFKKYFWYVKDAWNRKHSELTVKGYDVEVYIQDKSEKNAANGIYSLLKDKWLKVPKPMDGKFDRNYVTYVATDYADKIEHLDKFLDEDPSDEILEKILDYAQKLKDKIVQARRDSLNGDSSNEFSNDNIVFKVLRRSGHIELLNNVMDKAYDMENTLRERQLTEKETNNMDQKTLNRLFEEINKNKYVHDNCLVLINSFEATKRLNIAAIMKKIGKTPSLKNAFENDDQSGMVFHFKLNKVAAKTKEELKENEALESVKKALNSVLPEKFSNLESFDVNIGGSKYFNVFAF